MLAFLLSTLESNEDKEIFTKIYEQYRPLMERTATRILKEPSDIEDAVQNAFVQIIRHFDKIYEIPREELPFWIISIVKNEALLIIQKSQKTVSIENWDGYVIESENVLDYTELVNLFTKLPLSYRAVLEMKILHGYRTIHWKFHHHTSERNSRRLRFFSFFGRALRTLTCSSHSCGNGCSSPSMTSAGSMGTKLSPQKMRALSVG